MSALERAAGYDRAVPANDEELGDPQTWRAAVARHPVITAILVSFTLGGAVAGLWLLDADWSLTRRLLGGAVGGASVGLLISATKMLGP